MPHHWWIHVGHVHRNLSVGYMEVSYNYLLVHDLWCVLHAILLMKCHMSCI